MNVNNVLKSIYSQQKNTYLLIVIFVFTIIYMVLDDIHFSGLNKFQEMVRDELVKKEIEPKVNETAITNNDILNEEKNQHDIEGFDLMNPIQNMQPDDGKTELPESIEKKRVMDETTDKTKDAVESQELTPEQIKPSFAQRLFNRFYFSVITGCLLGYGDIYPVTNISKTLSLTQSLITVMLILS